MMKFILVISIMLLCLIGSLNSVYATFLPLMGSDIITQDTIQGFCFINNQTTNIVRCGQGNATLTITHGNGITVHMFPANATMWINGTGSQGPIGPQGPTGPMGQVHGVTAGTGISVNGTTGTVQVTNTVTDTNTAQIKNADGANVGLFGSRLNNTQNTIKTIGGSGSVTVTSTNSTHVNVHGDVFQNNTGTNLGTSGIGLYSGMSGSQLQFLKLICATASCSFSSNSTNAILTISLVDTNTAQISNAQSSGTGIFGSRLNATANTLKVLFVGTGLSIANNSTAITITNTVVDTNTAQLGNADNGESLLGSHPNATLNNIKTLRNATGYMNFNHNTTSITPTFLFKIDSVNCPVGQAIVILSNTTASSCATVLTSAVQTLNFTSNSDFDFNIIPRNMSYLTLDGQVFNFHLKNNIVNTNGSSQTITKALTLNNLILGGNANGNNQNFTAINQLNATKLFQNTKQVIDTLNQGTGISISGSGNSRTISSSSTNHGTYNQTLANNVLINSKGFKLNFINGTGNPIRLLNSSSGNMVNVTISSSGSSNTHGTYNETLANNTLVNSGGFKLNFINGTGAIVRVQNSTLGREVNVTITGTGSGITSVNGETGPAISIVRGSTATTITNSSNIITINDTGTNADVNFYHKTGSNYWYSGAITGGSVNNVSPTANRTTAYPMIVGKGFVVDNIGFRIGTNAANGRCMVGVYNDTGSIFPSILLASSSDFSTATGNIKNSSIALQLKSNSLYWLASNCSTGTTLAVATIPVTSIADILGVLNTSLANIDVDYVYTLNHPSIGFTLDHTFNSSATASSSTNIPMVNLRVK